MDLAFDAIMAITRANQPEGCGCAGQHEGEGQKLCLTMARSVPEHAGRNPRLA